MKLYLLPPSEGKQPWWAQNPMHRFFQLPIPTSLAKKATQKDLKCSGKRYEEAILLNKQLLHAPVMPAMQRYTGVLYTALCYATMTTQQQQWIDTHVLIISGMFGLVHPTDTIPNYKLPIETIWIRLYWYPRLTHTLLTYLQEHHITEIVDLLPWAYQRVIDWKLIEQAGIIHTIPTLTNDKKATHILKLLRWRWLRQQCLHIVQDNFS